MRKAKQLKEDNAESAENETSTRKQTSPWSLMTNLRQTSRSNLCLINRFPAKLALTSSKAVSCYLTKMPKNLLVKWRIKQSFTALCPLRISQKLHSCRKLPKCCVALMKISQTSKRHSTLESRCWRRRKKRKENLKSTSKPSRTCNRRTRAW